MSRISTVFNSLSFKLFIILLVTVLAAFTVHSFLCARNHSQQIEQQVKLSATRASDIIKRSLYTNMLLNERERTHENIRLIGQEPGVEVVRIYNKQGEIKFSSQEIEIGKTVDMRAEACYACHAADEPLQKLSMQEKARIYRKDSEYRVLGLINPIENQPECYNAACHAHSEEQTILGVLDVQMSLQEADQSMLAARKRSITISGGILLVSILLIAIIIYFAIYKPTKRLHIGTERLSEGDLDHRIELDRQDELGQLAQSFNRMAKNLKQANQELRDWSRTLEDRVEEKTEELEEMHRGMVQVEKMASLGRMAATVAHELNNPLSGIVTYAKVLMRKIKRLMPEDQEEREDVLEELDLIRSESQRCGNIVKDLLIFARESSADFQETQVHQVLERAINLVGHHLELENIRLERQFQLEDDEITCDQDKLVQALVALMVNAVEAMEDEGKLTLRTMEHPEEAGYIRIEVQDTGVGMSREVQEQIFDPFFSTKRETKGVGLGLAVVYGIIQRHNGKITVDSEVGKGTTFTIVLPREIDAENLNTEDSSTVSEGYDNEARE